MRALILLIPLVLVSCAYDPQHPGALNSPTLTDEDVKLISRSEMHEVIAVARRELNSMGLLIPIDAIDVTTPTRVKVLFHRYTHWFLLERQQGHWHIIERYLYEPTGVYVTGLFRGDLTMRWS
jgi:hypothetical protein